MPTYCFCMDSEKQRELSKTMNNIIASDIKIDSSVAFETLWSFAIRKLK